MRFSWSMHLLICLSLETLTSTIRDWLTYSRQTDRPSEICYNFSILNDLVNFPTRIPNWDYHSPALLDLFISSDASICSRITFPPLGNSDHVVVSVSNDFPSNSNIDVMIHRIPYVTGFSLELMYISLILNIRASLIDLYGFQLLVLLP